MNVADVTGKLYDRKWRNDLKRDTKAYVKDLGYDANSGAEFVVKESTKDVSYIIMPGDGVITEDFTKSIQAAGLGSAGSVGTAATASTLGTVTSTASSGGCVSSLGTAGTGA